MHEALHTGDYREIALEACAPRMRLARLGHGLKEHAHDRNGCHTINNLSN